MGIAYLDNGKRMEYEDYLKSPAWRNKKETRLAFDNWQCGICHSDVGKGYETHHLDYSRLGHENIETDLITLCHKCHIAFHNVWSKNEYWTNSESPYAHWKTYSLPDTTKLCATYYKEDVLLGGEYNLCSLDTIGGFIDQYYRDFDITNPVYICDKDVLLCIRNMRYEMFLEECKNVDIEEWLDSKYGKKGGKGGNPLRAKAKSFFTKHNVGAMKRIMKENESVNILMTEVKKYAETEKL